MISVAQAALTTNAWLLIPSTESDSIHCLASLAVGSGHFFANADPYLAYGRGARDIDDTLWPPRPIDPRSPISFGFRAFHVVGKAATEWCQALTSQLRNIAAGASGYLTRIHEEMVLC